MRNEKNAMKRKGAGRVLTAAQAAAVSNHKAQNLLVEALFRNRALGPENVRNAEDPETGAPLPVFEWHAFPGFGSEEYDAVERFGGVPTIRSAYGDWIGFTTCGLPYDAAVHPALAQAVYGVRTDWAGMRRARGE